jgi:hypothetical protein
MSPQSTMMRARFLASMKRKKQISNLRCTERAANDSA